MNQCNKTASTESPQQPHALPHTTRLRRATVTITAWWHSKKWTSFETKTNKQQHTFKHNLQNRYLFLLQYIFVFVLWCILNLSILNHLSFTLALRLQCLVEYSLYVLFFPPLGVHMFSFLTFLGTVRNSSKIHSNTDKLYIVLKRSIQLDPVGWRWLIYHSWSDQI